MARSIASFIGISLLCALPAACDKTGVTEEQKPGVTEQQKENQASNQVAQAKGQFEQQMENAQASAEKEIAGARADFERAREDYLHDKRTALADLDEKIARLDAEEKTATGKLKADIALHMPAIRAQRAAFGRRLQTLGTTLPATWDTAKADADKAWDALKTAVDDVPSR
jgi:hypothetical protein